LHQVGTSSLLIYMMHGHTYIIIFNLFSPACFETLKFILKEYAVWCIWNASAWACKTYYSAYTTVSM